MLSPAQKTAIVKHLRGKLSAADVHEVITILQGIEISEPFRTSDVLKLLKVLKAQDMPEEKSHLVRTALFDYVLNNKLSSHVNSTAKPANPVDTATSFRQNTDISHIVSKAQLSPKLVVFNTLFQQICQNINFDNPTNTNSLFDDLLWRCKHLKCSKQTQNAIFRWCRQRSDLSDESISAEELAELVRTSYVICCELIGPVLSDQCFSQALRQTATSPAARKFNPQQFF